MIPPEPGSTGHGGRGQLRDPVPPLISVVLPTYNEAKNLPLAVAAVEQGLGPFDDLSYEIIVVDDNSPDRTWAVAERLAQSKPRIQAIRRTNDRGLSSAVLLGMSLSRGQVLVVMDADLQHDASAIPAMITPIIEGRADMSLGSREAQGGSYGTFGKRRRAISWTGAQAAKALLGLEVSDPMSGFFAISRERFNAVAGEINPRGFKILLELLARGQQPRIQEVGYRFGERTHGATKLTTSVAVSYCLALLELTSGRFVSATFSAYAIVGLSGLALRLGVDAVLAAAGIGAGGIVGFELSVLWNYWLNNTFTFAWRSHRGVARLRGLLLFHLVAAQGLLIQRSISAYLVPEPAQDYERALRFMAGILIATTANFSLNSWLTWGRPQRQTLDGAA